MATNELDLQQILSHSPGYLFSAVARVLRANTQAALEPFRLSVHDYVVMRLVSRGVGLSQGDLGETYGIDPASMVNLIDRLEKEDLLTRLRDSADRRRYVLRLTPKGSRVLSRAQRTVTKTHKQFLQPINEEEWEIVRQCLWKILVAQNAQLASINDA